MNVGCDLALSSAWFLEQGQSGVRCVCAKVPRPGSLPKNVNFRSASGTKREGVVFFLHCQPWFPSICKFAFMRYWMCQGLGQNVFICACMCSFRMSGSSFHIVDEQIRRATLL